MLRPFLFGSNGLPGLSSNAMPTQRAIEGAMASAWQRVGMDFACPHGIRYSQNINMPSERHPAIQSATRVAAGDDRTYYDTFSISLHWLTALLVIIQFVLAVTWGVFPRPTRHLLIVTHMSLGIILTAVIAIRIVWRLTPGHAVAAATTGWVEVASKAVHYLLYAMLAAEAALGFIQRWSGGESMSFFGMMIPPPIDPFSKPMHQLIGEIHEWNGWAIVILAAGHAAAALYHHYVLRDSVLGRMLPSARKRGLS